MDFDISYDIILQIKNKGLKGLKRGIRGHDVERQGLLNICQRMREMDCEYIQLVLERSLDGFKKEYGLNIDITDTTTVGELYDSMPLSIFYAYKFAEAKEIYGLGDDVELTPAIEIFEDAWTDVTIEDIAMG